MSDVAADTREPADPLGDLVRENRLPLEQLQQLLAALSPQAYRQTLGADGRHTIGRHVRHIIDHYDALLRRKHREHHDNCDSDRVALDVSLDVSLDYEDRRRDPRLEQSPSAAVDRLEQIIMALAQLHEGRESARLTLEHRLGTGVVELDSSLERELAFLGSHTIHHMAIVGLLAEQLGQRLPRDFGVHPSTLRHWQKEAQLTTRRETA